MRSYMIDAFNSLSVISSLQALKLARNTSKSHEGASMWSFFFLKVLYSAALNARLCSEPSYRRVRPGRKKECLEVPASGEQPHPTYDSVDGISKTHAAFTRLIQPSPISFTQCAKTLVTKSLRYVE